MVLRPLTKPRTKASSPPVPSSAAPCQNSRSIRSLRAQQRVFPSQKGVRAVCIGKATAIYVQTAPRPLSQMAALRLIDLPNSGQGLIVTSAYVKSP